MSFDIAMDGILDFAATMFNALWPIFKIPLGLVLAFGILALVYHMIKGEMAGLGKG
jgi:hypothetical protein